MKEFVISEVKAESAILVGLITETQNEAKTKEYLDELEFLADTAGAVTVKRFTQKVNGPSAVTYVGKGKLEEIKAYIEQCEDNEEPIGMVIFDDELSAKQIRNIENELKVKILDRTSLILDIFAMCTNSQRQDSGGIGAISLHAAAVATTLDALRAARRWLWFRRRKRFGRVAWPGRNTVRDGPSHHFAAHHLAETAPARD